MVSKYVYPPRNLPGTAEVWGRSVENRDEILDRKIDVQTQKTDNALRAISGQLASASGQIIELQSRNSQTQTVSDFTFNSGSGGTTYLNWSNTTRTVSFDPPDLPRVATVFVSSQADSSFSSGAPAFVMRAEYGGQVVWASDSIYVGSGGGSPKPSGWVPTTSGAFVVIVPAGVSPSFTLRFRASIFGSSSAPVQVSNISATLSYANRV